MELPQLLDVALLMRQTVQFIHDGAPDHFTCDMSNFWTFTMQSDE
jgi:hypothetical protein